MIEFTQYYQPHGSIPQLVIITTLLFTIHQADTLRCRFALLNKKENAHYAGGGTSQSYEEHHHLLQNNQGKRKSIHPASTKPILRTRSCDA